MSSETCLERNQGPPSPSDPWVPATLSLDPGISTGCVSFDHDGSVRLHETISAERLEECLWELRRTRQHEIVLVERLPIALAKDMRSVIATVDRVFPTREGADKIVLRNLTYTRIDISPGQWKPMTHGLPVPFNAQTQHEKDAYWMALHWLIRSGFVRRPETF